MRDFHELRETGSPKQLIKSRVLPCIFLIDGFNMVGRFQVVIAEPVTPSYGVIPAIPSPVSHAIGVNGIEEGVT